MRVNEASVQQRQLFGRFNNVETRGRVGDGPRVTGVDGGTWLLT